MVWSDWSTCSNFAAVCCITAASAWVWDIPDVTSSPRSWLATGVTTVDSSARRSRPPEGEGDGGRTRNDFRR
ncbi:hypothetical protein GCM10027186_20850 [Micromonospora schwarzwaldensis]